jgi:hypothetical protein
MRKPRLNFLRNPDMAQRRQDLTHIPPGFTLTLEDHDLYWPFVPNVWSISTPANKATTEKTGIESSWWQFRFSRQPDAPTASGIVNSSRRDHTRTRCEVRIKVAKNSSTGIVTYTRTKASEGQEHSHFLNEIDQYKINSGVKNAVLEELRKGYSAKEVTKNFVGGRHHFIPG